MPANLALTYVDHSNEKATFVVAIPTVTPANIAATQTLINDLVAALDEIVLGNLNKRTTTIVTLGSAALVSDAEAQRETKWVIHMRDTQANLAAGVTNPYFGKQFTTSLGTAELTGNLATNTGFADITDPPMSDFVASFNAVARSPTGGTVAVTGVEHVGRNI